MFTREQGHTGNRHCTLTGGTRGHFGCDDRAHTEEHKEKACHELCEGTSHLCVRDVCTCVRLSDRVCTGVVCMRQLKPATTSLKKKSTCSVADIHARMCITQRGAVYLYTQTCLCLNTTQALAEIHAPEWSKSTRHGWPRTSARPCKNTK